MKSLNINYSIKLRISPTIFFSNTSFFLKIVPFGNRKFQGMLLVCCTKIKILRGSVYILAYHNNQEKVKRVRLFLNCFIPTTGSLSVYIFRSLRIFLHNSFLCVHSLIRMCSQIPPTTTMFIIKIKIDLNKQSDTC